MTSHDNALGRVGQEEYSHSRNKVKLILVGSTFDDVYE
jgi:hypothetical protein